MEVFLAPQKLDKDKQTWLYGEFDFPGDCKV